MNLKTQMTFFEFKSPDTKRKQFENYIIKPKNLKKKGNNIDLNFHNTSTKAPDIPDIFSHSIDRHKKMHNSFYHINLSKQKIGQKQSKSQEKNYNSKDIPKKDYFKFPIQTNFSLSNINYFPHRRNKIKDNFSNSLTNNENNSFFKDKQQYNFLNKHINHPKENHYYKNKNKGNIISTSLPKINLGNNPICLIKEKDRKKEEKENKKRRAISQKNINNMKNIQSQLIYNQNENNNSQIILEDILRDAYAFYQPAKHSENIFDKIISYGVNTYKGRIRQYNEDRVTILINSSLNKNIIKDISNFPKISLFSIYDGHGGNKCCEFLKTNLHHYIFDSEFFPKNPIKAIEQGFKNCERQFTNLIYSHNQCTDSSGSCAIIVLIINDSCYIANLGDSRALYSLDDGKNFYQLSRDHKPNDPMEKKRIYKAGGNVYKTNIQQVSENGIGFKGKESIISLPYRIYPGRLSVSYF